MLTAGKPLNGLKVLELGQVIAGPFAGAILSDLGAEVTKIERVDGGDEGRRMGQPFRHGDSLVFQIFNRGKSSMTLDLKSAEGQSTLLQMAANTDLIVHNLRHGVLETMGLDGKTLCATYPRLIFCEISAFGHTGPMAFHPGYEPLIQAYSGLSSTNGGPDDPPVRVGPSVCDQGAGMWAVIGLLALLQQRNVTGRGGVVNTSLLETALCWNGQKNDAWLNLGELPVRHASGHPGFVPYEAFDTADGPLLICCGNDRLFVKLAEEIGRPEWVSDARFINNRARIDHKNELLPMLSVELKKITRDEWVRRFEAIGVPVSPVHSLVEAMNQEQVTSLQMTPLVPGENFVLTALPLSFDGVRPQVRSAAPGLNERKSG